MSLQRKYEVYVRLLLFTIVAAVLLSFYASSNTLVHSRYGFDYTIFKIIGEAWAGGQIPYRDIFDQKGPLMFFIQMIAFMVPVPKLGTWLLELIWVVATCEMLFRCGRYIGASKRLSFISVIMMLLFYAKYVDGGDTVEMWSLPLEILPLLMLLRYLQNHKNLAQTAFVTGLCFGLVAMIRVNNNAIIVSLVIGMIVYLCRRGEFRTLLNCMALFLAGLATAVIPFILYFLIVGAIDDLIYCVFTLSVKYMDKFGVKNQYTIFNNAVKLLPCVIFLIEIAFYAVKKGGKLPMFFLLMPVITFFTICFGLEFNHYFLMQAPLVALGIQLSWPFNRHIKAIVFAAYLFLGLWNLRLHTIERIEQYKDKVGNKEVYRTRSGQKFVSEFIPDIDKTSVYVFGNINPARALTENGYLPVGKYFFQQDSYNLLDQRVHDDIIEKFVEANPKWVIAESIDMEPLTEYMGNYEEMPRDSLPDTCPSNWHIYKRKL